MDTKLPDKLSDLLEIAIDDAEAFEATPGCQINASLWLIEKDGLCEACLAGAVARRRLAAFGLPFLSEVDMWTIRDIELQGIDVDTRKKLVYIDMMRSGRFECRYFDRYPVDRVWECLKPVRDDLFSGYTPAEARVATKYPNVASWSAYREAIANLREAGL